MKKQNRDSCDKADEETWSLGGGVERGYCRCAEGYGSFDSASVCLERENTSQGQ